mmetsp:Transcript_27274/g.47280  ORF Transcript_27274/g.47280 Transcript_27274/m.47280 type:complete len:353 (+) Transcript_27274:211-1269(+)
MNDLEQANKKWCDSEKDGKISVGEFANKIRRLPFAKLFSRHGKRSNGRRQSHWWTSFIERIFDIVCVDSILSGEIPWISSFAFLDETSLSKTNPDQGTLMPSSSKPFHHVFVDMLSGSSYIAPLKHHPRQSTSVTEALSYTSAFWAAPLVTAHTIPYNLFSNLLLRANSSTSYLVEPTISNKVILDGGVIDTTGLVGLLQQQTEHIIAFYNNNAQISKIRSPIAYLFGVDATTDSMNSLLGPSLSQVFPSELYPNVIANLTNPKVGMAHLRGINVLPNQMGVEPYVIKNLVIFSNGKNDNFILEERIMSELSPSWPDRYLFSPPQLDANALCMFNDWKVRSHREDLDPILGL